MPSDNTANSGWILVFTFEPIAALLNATSVSSSKDLAAAAVEVVLTRVA